MVEVADSLRLRLGGFWSAETQGRHGSEGRHAQGCRY
jgi:hypothetical protein